MICPAVQAGGATCGITAQALSTTVSISAGARITTRYSSGDGMASRYRDQSSIKAETTVLPTRYAASRLGT